MTQHPSPAVDSLTVDTAGSSDAKAAAARRPGRSATHNSSLLLRLFTSQFFDSWLAVSYIFRYPHLVGVQHYLCNELRRFPPAEVEFFLPQLVHLLITRPNESTAVESLLMDMALQSSHVAMTLYWYLQAYLSDLSPNPRTAQFKHCQRIFNQVQELLFTDIAPELIIDAPEPVQENVYAALVGIASTAASLSAPSLASTMGWVAVAQGQTVKLSEKLGDDYDLLPQPRSLAGRVRGSNTLPSRPAASTSRHTRSTPKPLNISIGANGSVQKLAAGGAHWAPASHPTTAGEAYDRAWSSSSAHTKRPKLERRAGYFSSEIKFVTALMDISQRVCAVPKVGRQQFLKAELTLFNHALDHNACVPLWCPDAGGARHHRIVRIPTEDTVVLNSAERAPYLLTLEVLEPSDSDPTHTKQQPPNEAHLALNASSNSAMASRVPTSQEEIRARMRTASILLAQLARQQKALGIKIREKLVREMMQLEELRLKQPGLGSTSDPGAAAADTSRDMDSDINVREVEFKDDPSAKVLKEDWESKKARIRRASPYGRQKNWNLLSVIIKEGADLRQEQLALQLIREMQRIWALENTNVFVQYYRIMVTGESCGIMETITNTVSVHSIKKEFYSRNPGYAGPPYTLYNYFVTSYGTPDTARFREAQNCFMRSLVAYSLITYILQIRDRHNGNILLDTAGHIIHIDFGFMLYNSPGSVGFEQAPFKFPMEYVDILGGRDSAKFAEFRKLMVTAFLALRKHADNVCLLVEMMIKDSPLPCLGGGPATVTALRERFHLGLSEQQIEDLIDNMLVSSCDNITTRMYDAFQYYSNGIL
ncbi:kinase-like domain-containing protein [Coemansia mojavensis]|nr:kinase-like domain-containing protein [Coemansia mojavensis]